MTDEIQESRAPAAPYTAFSSVKTAVRQMKEHGIPSRVDRSVLTNFSGAVTSQVMTALKFLSLIDSEGRPGNGLKSLVDAIDSESDWPKALAQVLQYAYAPLFAADLQTASPSQFNELFKKNYPGADDVLRKSMTFFLNAAREANIPISKYILKNKKPRANPAKRRASKPVARNVGGSKTPFRQGAEDATPPPPNTDNKPMEYQLLDLIGPEMSEEERAAVWTLIGYVKKQPKGAA
jgi:hypothetical protein